MERSEPALVPEWLKSSGSATGSGNQSSSSSLSSSSLHADNRSAPRHARNKLSISSDQDIGHTSALDRTTSPYFRRSYSSNSSAYLRSSRNYSKSHRDRDWDKDINGHQEKYRSIVGEHKHLSDSLDSILPTAFERDILRRTQSTVTGKHGDSWAKKLTSDTNSSSKRTYISNNGLLRGVGTVIGNKTSSDSKSAFERDFPLLVSEETHVGLEIGRVPSPGLSTTIQSFPAGTLAGTGGDSWTSALAEAPLDKGSNGTCLAPAQQTVPTSSASVSSAVTAGLNMAETLAQGPSRARTPPELNVTTQRLEELAIKQSRQLIPMTPSMPKAVVANPSERSKPKSGQQQHPSVSLNHTRGATSRSDTGKTSSESRLQVLKPSRELNSIPLTTKDSLNPTNGGKFVNSPLSITPSGSASASSRSSSQGGFERNSAPFQANIEKRSAVQAQSRNDFFNLIKMKSSVNSPSLVPACSSAVSISVPEKSADFDKKNTSASNKQEIKAHSSEAHLTDVAMHDGSEITQNGDTYDGSVHLSGDAEMHSKYDVVPFPDEKEAAFLRSLGWEENAGDDECLTEEEINAFYKEYMKLRPSEKLLCAIRPTVMFNSQVCCHNGASSESSSSDESEP